MYHQITTWLLLACFINCCSGVDPNAATVAQYVQIIQKGINEAQKYTLPVDASAYKPISNTIKDGGTFDYIIIGSGSAGSVIASRLSEDKKSRILLLEAGGEENDFSDIPGMATYLSQSRFNWGYKMVPQKNACLGMIDNSCAVPRGKGLGGSSLINAMMYSRGNKLDYDQWAKAGNPGWSYDYVLPLFKKSEHSTINGDFGYHGKNGPWNVEYHTPKNNTEVLTFLEANRNLQIPVLDYNGRRELGASLTQLNTINGRRQSLAKSFLLPVRDKRPNLQILTNSYVVKILINNVTKEAGGVIFSRGGKLHTAFAQKEVILSAGVINSPHLLMLSGIGPAQHLADHDIPLIQDLAVGENLQDHPAFAGLMFESSYVLPNITLEEMVRQYLNGMGWLAIGYGTEALGFYQLNQKSGGRPDIELINKLTLTNVVSGNIMQRFFRFTNETFNAMFSNVDGRRAFSVPVIFLHPNSKGRVTLQSANPFDYPLIDHKLLDDTNGTDIDMMFKAVQFAIKLVQAKAFKDLNATMVKVVLPQCKDHEYLSKDYWYCNIKHLTATLYHPIGTCKMGPDPKKGAVVDSQMRVHGVKKLRVADASIIPFALSGHTSAPTAMIGEYLACLINKERCWGLNVLFSEFLNLFS